MTRRSRILASPGARSLRSPVGTPPNSGACDVPRIDIGRAGIAAQVDGAALVMLSVRRLGRHDLPEVKRHLLELGPADRRARFGTVLSDAAIAAYVWRIDPDQAVLI